MTGPARWVHTGYAQQVLFGAGTAGELADVVAAAGGRRVVVVTTPGRRASPEGEALVAGLGRLVAAVYPGVRRHVPVACVDEALAVVRRSGADCLVSFGGGSCADLAKAVAHAAAGGPGGLAGSYLDRPTLPHVAVPTTYSGAELTPFFGVTDEAGRKTGAGGPTLAPVAAVYDPVLTLGTPARVSAETGMNCLAHGVEAAWSGVRTPEAEAVALACVARAGAALPAVAADPGDVEARTAMLAAAVLGGRCLQNASMGVHHGLSQLVGARTGMPHGLANAVLLAHSIRFNAPAVPEAVASVARALGRPDDAAGAVDDLRRRLGLPGGLAEAGATDADLEAVAEASGSNGNVRNNPRPVSPADALELLRAAM